jgi:hypothetical protein
MDLSKSGALCSPVLRVSYVKPIEKYIAFEPWSGSKCQLHSQGKITTPKRENRKIQHANVILKANERLHKVRDLRSAE